MSSMRTFSKDFYDFPTLALAVVGTPSSNPSRHQESLYTKEKVDFHLYFGTLSQTKNYDYFGNLPNGPGLPWFAVTYTKERWYSVLFFKNLLHRGQHCPMGVVPIDPTQQKYRLWNFPEPIFLTKGLMIRLTHFWGKCLPLNWSDEEMRGGWL